MKALFLFFLCAAPALLLHAQPSLLPRPRQCEWDKGSFRTDRPYRFENLSGMDVRPVANLLERAGTTQTTRLVRCERSTEWSGRPEAYRLHVSRDTVRIAATDEAGFLRAAQTLRQLVQDERLKCCRISDFPAYSWRGLMIDVSRHFFDTDCLKRQIDLMAAVKLNRLHLHLTDAAGWRMEIKRFPRLTEIGAWRTDSLWKTWWNDTPRHYASARTPGAYGGFYTQQELRELVEYAAQRGITVVPEIEMPAHSEEVLTAYPELSCTHEPYKQADFCPGSEETFQFLQEVLVEVMQVFPSVYIHLGGDEAGKASWADCPRCRQRMWQLGLHGVDELQHYFMQRMARFLEQHGRHMLAWDEVTAPGLPEGTAIMVWRDASTACQAARLGYEVVMSPGAFCYLDSYQDAPPSQPEAIGGYLPLARVYGFAPSQSLPDSLRSRLLGLQGNLWTEYVPTQHQLEYMLYPRALALAETGWRGDESKDWTDFRRRATGVMKRLDEQSRTGAFDLRTEQGERREAGIRISHKARGAQVSYGQPYHPRYASTGAGALTDGWRGGWSPSDGRWQGFIKGDRLDVTVDLGRLQTVKKVACDFMQACGAEIYYPASFRVSVSSDGAHFTELCDRKYPSQRTVQPDIRTCCWKGRGCRARYVRIQALPAVWGGWVFTDEVVVK